MKNYYEILGISETASFIEIKKAYRKLAHQMHPDKNPHDIQANSKFQEINEAYEILYDQDKRTKYDIEFGNYKKARQEAMYNESQKHNANSVNYSPSFSDLQKFVFLFILLLIGSLAFARVNSEDKIKSNS